MVKIRTFLHKIHNRWTKLRLQPIRVFCIHHVTDTFDADLMWQCDWMQTDIFKQKVTELQKKYTFISLTEAQKHLREDWLRCKHYAVMTADDGFASMKEIVPWLVERNIPITLFINPVVWDGKTIGKNLLSLPIVNRKNGAESLYLTFEELKDRNDEVTNETLKNIDVLVDSPFIMSLLSYDTPFRGSKNQRIIDVPKSLKTKKVCEVLKYKN